MHIKEFEEFEKAHKSLNEGRTKGAKNKVKKTDSVEKQILDKISSEKSYANDDIYTEERELSPGEKRAFLRGFQVMTDSQLAILYLRALGQVKEGEPGKYLVGIEGISSFGKTNKNSREFEISIPGICDAAGIDSTITAGRTVKKFMNLLNNIGDTKEETIYPKIIKAYDRFSKMKPRDIALLAAEEIEDPSNTKHRTAAENAISNAKHIREEQKKFMNKVGEAVYKLLIGFNDKANTVKMFDDPDKNKILAAGKIALEKDLTLEYTTLALKMYAKEKNIKGI